MSWCGMVLLPWFKAHFLSRGDTVQRLGRGCAFHMLIQVQQRYVLHQYLTYFLQPLPYLCPTVLITALLSRVQCDFLHQSLPTEILSSHTATKVVHGKKKKNNKSRPKMDLLLKMLNCFFLNFMF